MPKHTNRTIAALLRALGHELRLRGDPNRTIAGLSYDSRRVRPRDLFVALPGLHTDGHHFIERAIERGAVAILHQHELERYRKTITYLQSPDPRLAMSTLADAFYDHPSRRLSVIGVTGTDGKSTTVWLIHQLLEQLGEKSGFLSTVQIAGEGPITDNPLRQSTPESPEIQRVLAGMVEAGRHYAVLEATSHGLSAQTARLVDVRFTAAVCTNIHHEHLEFHGSFEQYRSDKANLFRSLSPEGFGVVNVNDPSHGYLIEHSAAEVLGYGVDSAQADLWAGEVRSDLSGSRLTLHYGEKRQPARLELPGSFNVENLLAAALTVLRLLGVSLCELAVVLPRLRGVPGRMEPVSCGQPFRVIVDYAHTPQSFAGVLPLVRRHTEGRLITVFGSAGERDVEKRPLQGETALRHSDFVILTDEDPRGERPETILEQIAAGCLRVDPACGERQRLLLIPDRRQAISRALALAHPGDTVLLLGKGHERSIIYDHGPIPWNEAEVAREILQQMGFSA